jgi:hypothetical protein
MLRRAGFVPLVVGFVFALSAHAQEIVVRGLVLGPDGRPLALDRVVLHRVHPEGGATVAGGSSAPDAAGGGATVAEGSSGLDGRFVLTAPVARDTTDVYFVAARYQGELYIGRPFRPAVDGTPDQVLQVGVFANSAAALLANAEGSAVTPARARVTRNPYLFIVPVLMATIAVFYLIVPRRRVTPERAMLIRIAEIDERLPDAPHGQRDSLHAERMRLVDALHAG